jgi:acetoacetyl-CoA synthetase
MGVSAKFIDGVQKQHHKPSVHDLRDLRVVLSTGSPLSPEGFAHIYADWKADVQLASICGGTDILGVFVGGCPVLPVWQGEIPCAALGLDVTTLGEDGQPVSGEPGELVCRNAHPSMPTRFLNDPGDSRYRAAYFDTYPNVWRQGDFALRTEHGGFIVLGRSDATLNPGGIRIGTAEIYRQLTDIDEIVDSVVIGQSFENDTRVVLFVMLASGSLLDDTLIKRVKTGIRNHTTPRHVPAKIIAVEDIPRTHSGKIAELAVRDVVNNQPVRNLTGLANPEALRLFENLQELAV